MRKFIASCAVVLIAFTIAAGEEVTGIITKVDGNKVTFKKGGFGKKGGEEAKEVILNAEGAKVVKGKSASRTRSSRSRPARLMRAG